MSEVVADLLFDSEFAQEPAGVKPGEARKGMQRAADTIIRSAVSLSYFLLFAGLFALYVWTAVNGGITSLLEQRSRYGEPLDLYYPRSQLYHLHPFEEMFFPLRISNGAAGNIAVSRLLPAPARRSLVVFTSGKSGIANVDLLVRTWGFKHYDYVICHFDESQEEWAKLDWYKKVVRFSAHRQGKMWFFKRAVTPWLAEGYEYVHFVDSDAGSPPEQPFDLLSYERVLLEHNVVLGQPAVTNKEKSSVHDVCKQNKDYKLRWTNFVENGPLFSVHVPDRAFQGLWEMVDPSAVSGYGVDMGWCAYLYERKGFVKRRTCAVVDAHPIDHLDTHSATGQLYGAEQKDYAHYGFREWEEYGRVLGGMLRGWQQPISFQDIKA